MRGNPTDTAGQVIVTAKGVVATRVNILYLVGGDRDEHGPRAGRDVRHRRSLGEVDRGVEGAC